MNLARLEQDPARGSTLPQDRTDRYHSELELARPFDVTSWLHAYPFVKVDETYYSHDLNDESRFRHVPSLGFELNSKFWNTWDFRLLS